MKQKKIIAVVLTLLVILILPLAASAEKNTYRFKGTSANANFSSYDGCTSTFVSITGNEQVINSVREAKAFAYVSKYNECTGEFTDAYGESVLSNRKDLDIRRQLQSAKLATTITVYDFWTGAPTDLQINLTWTGIGDVSKGQVKQKSVTGKCKFEYRSKGSSRSADVSGSISDGATDYVSGTTASGFLSEGKDTQIVVNCN